MSYQLPNGAPQQQAPAWTSTARPRVTWEVEPPSGRRLDRRRGDEDDASETSHAVEAQARELRAPKPSVQRMDDETEGKIYKCFQK